jgi:hypothetical protein
MSKTTISEFKGINRDALSQLSKEQLLDLLVKSDEYAYAEDGFHVLDEKYLIYEEKEVETGRPITREEFEEAIAKTWTETFKNAFETVGGYKP